MLKKYLPVNFLFNVHLSNFNNDVMVTVSFLTYNWHNIQVKKFYEDNWFQKASKLC